MYERVVCNQVQSNMKNHAVGTFSTWQILPTHVFLDSPSKHRNYRTHDGQTQPHLQAARVSTLKVRGIFLDACLPALCAFLFQANLIDRLMTRIILGP